jgi:hypothetical protein
VRQIRMLRAMRRELETGLRWLLHGHAGGNPGHGQGATCGSPRQFPTLPRSSALQRNDHNLPIADAAAAGNSRPAVFSRISRLCACSVAAVWERCTSPSI